MPSLGSRITAARKYRGLTQAALGRRILKDGSIIARWESNRVTPDTENVIGLAQALRVTTDYLLGLTDLRSGLLDDPDQNDDLPFGGQPPDAGPPQGSGDATAQRRAARGSKRSTGRSTPTGDERR